MANSFGDVAYTVTLNVSTHLCTAVSSYFSNISVQKYRGNLTCPTLELPFIV